MDAMPVLRDWVHSYGEGEDRSSACPICGKNLER